MRHFSEFTHSFIRRTFTPLLLFNDGIEDWLAASHYSETDKQRLRQVYYQESDVHSRARKVCKAFLKDEMYDDIKFARTINARHDLLKTLLGPLSQEVERAIFKHPAFIKKIPMHERPDYVLGVMSSPFPIIVEGDDGLMQVPGHLYSYSFDYEAYESLFTKMLMEICELDVFFYMLGGGAFATWFVSFLRQLLTGWNYNRYGNGLRVRVKAKRMSGEMITSLGNGVTNLFILAYLFTNYVLKGIDLTPAHFERLGLRVKLVKHDDAAEASFCGMVFDPSDKQIIRDPVPTLLKLGWCRMPYVNSSYKTRVKLLRLKALSLAYESECCPILSAVARRLLELTAPAVRHDRYLYKYCSRWEKEWMEQNTRSLTWPAIGENTRSLFAKLYGVSIADQLAIEEACAEMPLGPAPQVLVDRLHIPPRFGEFWDSYVSPCATAGVGWAVLGSEPDCLTGWPGLWLRGKGPPEGTISP